MTSVERVRQILKGINARVDIEAVKDGVPLGDQGIDSLDRMNLFLEVEEAFSLKIPDEDVDRLATIVDIATYVDAK